MKTKLSLSSLANHHAVKLHMFYLLTSISPIDTIVHLLCNDNLHIRLHVSVQMDHHQAIQENFNKESKSDRTISVCTSCEILPFFFRMYELYMNALLVAWLINAAFFLNFLILNPLKKIFIHCCQIVKKFCEIYILVHKVFTFLFFPKNVYIQPDNGPVRPKHVYQHTTYSLTINV